MSKDLLDPFDDSFDDEVSPDNFFDNLGRNMFNGLRDFRDNSGRANVVSDPKDYKVTVELPGFKKDGIDLDYRKNTLRVVAKHNVSKKSKDKKGKVIRQEYSNNNVARSFYLPNVNFDSISASYDGGILKVNLPKKAETKPDNHRINIK